MFLSSLYVLPNTVITVMWLSGVRCPQHSTYCIPESFLCVCSWTTVLCNGRVRYHGVSVYVPVRMLMIAGVVCPVSILKGGGWLKIRRVSRFSYLVSGLLVMLRVIVINPNPCKKWMFLTLCLCF
jgi:hypothetical protein